MNRTLTPAITKVISGAIGAAIVGALVLLNSCSGKALEPFNDSGVSAHYNGPAATGNMPDGFSNWATKCADPGHRIYVAFHGDSAYGAIAVINDAKC